MSPTPARGGIMTLLLLLPWTIGMLLLGNTMAGSVGDSTFCHGLRSYLAIRGRPRSSSVDKNQTITTDDVRDDHVEPCDTLLLRYERLSVGDVRELASELENDMFVTAIDFRGSHFDTTSLKLLVSALEKNTMVTSIDLSTVQLGDAGATEIARLLRHNAVITSLTLRLTDIGDDGAVEIAKAVRTNIALSALNFRSNGVESVGAIAFANAIKDNNVLSVLDIGDNNLGAVGMVSLANAVPQSSITQLNILRTNPGKDGIIAIAKMLKLESKLKSLDLTHNDIGNQIHVIADSISSKHCGLEILSLQNNNLDQIGIGKLADALLPNSKLQYLGLRSNLLGNHGAQQLIMTLTTNNVLKTVDYYDATVDLSLQKELASLLERNNGFAEGVLFGKGQTGLTGDDDDEEEEEELGRRKYTQAPLAVPTRSVHHDHNHDQDQDHDCPFH